MYLMAKKKSYIAFVSEVIERHSTIRSCKYEGKQCLHTYIKTRFHQPDMCINCLKELNKLNNYQVLKLQKHRHKRNYEV